MSPSVAVGDFVRCTYRTHKGYVGRVSSLVYGTVPCVHWPVGSGLANGVYQPASLRRVKPRREDAP